ncbi:MAG: ROK family protein [Stappiaceae bacterium]
MNSPVAIGIDLGGTRVRAALVTREGLILDRVEQPTRASHGQQSIIEQIVNLARGIVKRADPPSVAGLGICSPGPLDTDAGMVLSAPTIKGFTDFPLREELQSRLPWPVYLENDGIAATLGEWRFGAGRSVDHMVYITVSTGIGGGAVVDGNLLRGRRGMAGHIGHMVIAMDGRPCPCGNRGCWEASASGTALSKMALENGFADGIQVFNEARDGNEAALQLVAFLSRQLGVGMVNLAHIFSPKKIVMGGGVSNALDLLEPGIRHHIEKNAMPPFRTITLEKAQLGDNSGVIGMAELVFSANTFSVHMEASE